MGIQNVAMALTSLVQTEKRLEVSKNVKYIAVTLRASKLQVSKVGELWDLNRASRVSQFPYVK